MGVRRRIHVKTPQDREELRTLCAPGPLGLAFPGFLLLTAERFLVSEKFAARWPAPDGGVTIGALKRSGGAMTRTVPFFIVERDGMRSRPIFKGLYDDDAHSMDVRWFSNSSAGVSLGREAVSLRGERSGLRNTVLGVKVEVGP